MKELQERFCIEFVKSGNATEAYKAAGYKVSNDRSAAACAAALLRKSNISKRLEELREKISSSKIMDAQERRELMTKIAKNKKTLNTDRLKAIDLLNKMDGVYINKTQISGDGGGAITFKWDGDAK